MEEIGHDVFTVVTKSRNNQHAYAKVRVRQIAFTYSLVAL
jgi:hypothetical protein